MEEFISHNAFFRWTLLGVGIIYLLFATIKFYVEKERYYFRNEWEFQPVRSNSLFYGIEKFIGLATVIIVIFWIADCPVPWDSGVDRDLVCVGYEWNREYCRTIWEAMGEKDSIWQAYIFLCSRLFDYKVWLYLTSTIYVGNYLWASVRLFGRNYTPMILAFIGGFAFYSYGISGIRSGVGASLIILGLSYWDQLRKMTVCVALAVACHISMLLPALSLLGVSLIFGYNKKYPFTKSDNRIIIGALSFWICCLFFSLVCGDWIMDQITAPILKWPRIKYLAAPETQVWRDEVYQSGVRWDFIIFSLTGPFAAFFYRYCLSFKERLYDLILTTYLIVNAVWLPVIRLPFTDRIAYLSWILIPLLIFYPLISINSKKVEELNIDKKRKISSINRLEIPKRRKIYYWLLPFGLLVQIIFVNFVL